MLGGMAGTRTPTRNPGTAAYARSGSTGVPSAPAVANPGPRSRLEKIRPKVAWSGSRVDTRVESEMPTSPTRRPIRPIALPGTAGVMVAVLLATCAVVAAEAQWRGRELRARDGQTHASCLALASFPGIAGFAEHPGNHPGTGTSRPNRSVRGDAAAPRSGNGGFGGSREAIRLRALLNTPPPAA